MKNIPTATIFGFGLYENGSGIESAKYYLQKGYDLIITDLRTTKQLKVQISRLEDFMTKKKIKNTVLYRLGKHLEEDFLPENTDLIIKNPGVPPHSKYLKIARKHNVKITTDTNTFFEHAVCDIIGITGTRGKSTTTKLIYEILRKNKNKAILGGNIMLSPLSKIKSLTKKHTAVLELPAQQLHELQYIQKSPKISVMTNFLPDHLNFYKSKAHYLRDKEIIFDHQKKNDIAVLNYDDEATRKIGKKLKSKILWFSLKKLPEGKNGAYYTKGNLIYREGTKEQKIIDEKNIWLFGKHNIANILAAITVAKKKKIKNSIIKEVLTKYKGVEYRMEYKKQKSGIMYFNDSTSTTPDATISAIKALGEKYPEKSLTLIAGGMAKITSYKTLNKDLYQYVSKLILIPGTASKKIEQGIKKSWKTNVKTVPNIKEAMEYGQKNTKTPGIILFSPGAASFNQFSNEIDRANQFDNLIS